MSQPFLAEIKMVAFTFAQRGWAFCDGQILPINQNQSLFSLLGTTYGGDGRTSFALPDLRGRTPIAAQPQTGSGQPHGLGQKGGAERVTLTAAEMPNHTHAFKVSTADATLQRAANTNDSVIAKANLDMYRAPATDAPLSNESVTSTGGGQAHNNIQPTLVVYFVIALQGLFPSRN